MNDENTKSGKRYEIIVMRINRNNSGALKQLFALEDYFKKQGNDYSLMHASYGTPAKALKKVVAESNYKEKENIEKGMYE